MSLEDKLQAIRDQAKENFPSEILESMHKATSELRNSGILEHVTKVGETLLPFELPNIEKDTIRSQYLLEKGSLVLTFYRGVW